MILATYLPQIFSRSIPSNERTAEHLLRAIRTKAPFDFQALRPNELKTLLDEIAILLKPDELDRLADMLPLETLQETVRIQYPEHVSALETAKSMLQEAKYYLSATETQVTPALKVYLNSILDSLISILESFLGAFGIADFFKAPETSFDSDYKGQKIMLILTLFTVLNGILMPLLGPALGAMVIGGTLLSIATISLIYPHIKPQATELMRGENLTKQYEQGELFAIDGRKETLDAMARGLCNSHVMLLGQTGVGKTATVKAFVQAVARGDYPELHGKQIIYFNTANLLAGTEMFSNVNKIFSQTSEAMSRHRDNFILIFDEIHTACQERDDGPLSEQLKTYLDPGKDKFPYVIGITTEEEYYRDIFGKNPAFARRFPTRIVIQNTDDPETIKILNNALLKQSPATLVEQDTLQTLLNLTKQTFPAAAQPATSIKILSQCLIRTASSQRSPLELRVEELRRRITTLYAQGAGRLPYGRAREALPLETELRQMEEQLRVAKEQLKALFEQREQLAEIKKSALKRILNADKLSPETLSRKEKKELNAFILQTHFQTRLLETKIRQDAEALQVKVAIDPALIGEVIAEEQVNEQRVQEAIARARAQINARAP